MRNRIKLLWPYIATVIFWLLFLFVIFGFCGCKTKYVSVPEYHTEYITKTDSFTQRDSILVRDSVYMWMKGDTIYKEKYSVIYKDRFRDRYLCDTIIKVDSVMVPYPVERQLTKWESFRQQLGTYAAIAVMIGFLAVIGILIGAILKWIKRHN